MSENQRNPYVKRLDNPYDSADQNRTAPQAGDEARSGMDVGFERQLGGGPGSTLDLGGKAEPKTSFGEPTGGLYSDPGDGTIGEAATEFLERRDKAEQI